MKNNKQTEQALLPEVEEMGRAVILSLLVQSDAMADLSGRIEERMFFHAGCRLAYQAIRALYDRQADVDMLTIEQEMRLLNPEVSELQGGLTFFSDGLTSVRRADHIRTYAAHVLRAWGLRTLHSHLRQRTLECCRPETDILSLFAAVHADVEQLETFFTPPGQASLAGSMAKEVLETIFEEQRRQAAGELLQIPTGIKEFDQSVGGLYRGELQVLAGRPSMGKTAISLHMALSAARQGNKVGLFSFEMIPRQLISRLLSCLSGIHPDKLRFQRLTQAERETLCQAQEELEKLPIYIDYCSGATIGEVRARCRQLHRLHHLDLVMIDYLNLFPVASGENPLKNTMDLALGDITRQIKGMVMELDVAGVLVAQLNRQCEMRTDHTPVMSDLRNSGEIEQIADSVVFIYRPEFYREFYDKQTKEDMRGVGQLFIAKNRNGSTGEVRFRYNSSLTQIRDY